MLIPGIGREVNGSRRWISLGVVNVQPSEFMKLAGRALRGRLHGAQGRVHACEQPLRQTCRGFAADVRGDGRRSAACCCSSPTSARSWSSSRSRSAILFLGGLNWRLFVGPARAARRSRFVALILVAAPYRLQRLLGFLDPWADPLGKGYQLSHSLIAFGRGEWLGVGLGASVEKLLYLPEAHTDFLLAVIAEELGFAGVARGDRALRAGCVFRAFAIGRQAARLERPFAALVAQGIGVWIGVQAFINMGVNMGVLPTKGLTLPLLSFGGSGIVANCVALAILLRVDYENRRLLRGYAA